MTDLQVATSYTVTQVYKNNFETLFDLVFIKIISSTCEMSSWRVSRSVDQSKHICTIALVSRANAFSSLWHCQLGKVPRLSYSSLVQLSFGCNMISHLLTYDLWYMVYLQTNNKTWSKNLTKTKLILVVMMMSWDVFEWVSSVAGSIYTKRGRWMAVELSAESFQ